MKAWSRTWSKGFKGFTARWTRFGSESHPFNGRYRISKLVKHLQFLRSLIRCRRDGVIMNLQVSVTYSTDRLENPSLSLLVSSIHVALQYYCNADMLVMQLLKFLIASKTFDPGWPEPHRGSRAWYVGASMTYPLHVPLRYFTILLSSFPNHHVREPAYNIGQILYMSHWFGWCSRSCLCIP